MVDTDAIIRAYLAADPGVAGVVGVRVYCPRLPEDCTLPALSFFTRGGAPLPSYTRVVTPSIQIDCWATTLAVARQLYGEVYEALHAHWGYPVVIGGTTYAIMSAQEEVHGQDMMDVDGAGSFIGYWRVLSFYSVAIKVEP